MSFSSNFIPPEKAIDPVMAVTIEGKKQKALLSKEASISKLKIQEHMKMVSTTMYGAKEEINQLILIKKEEAKEECHVMNKLKLDLKAERFMIECERKKLQSAYKECIEESNVIIDEMKQLLKQIHMLKNEVEGTPAFKKMKMEVDIDPITAAHGDCAAAVDGVGTTTVVTPDIKLGAVKNPYLKVKENDTGVAIGSANCSAKDLTDEFASEVVDNAIGEMKMPVHMNANHDVAQIEAANTLLLASKLHSLD